MALPSSTSVRTILGGEAYEGATNREIATGLLISPKTVEASLGRTFTKLEIRSRARLGSALVAVHEVAAEADRVLRSFAR